MKFISKRLKDITIALDKRVAIHKEGNDMRKKVISAILALIMTVGMCPALSFAHADGQQLVEYLTFDDASDMSSFIMRGGTNGSA